MKCHICYNYRRTKERCRRKGVCRKCGEDDPLGNKINKPSNESKCENCGEGQIVGSKDYEMERNERVTRKMQADSRLGGIRALQILGEDESARSNPHSYPTHYRCKMDPENKRKFNP